MICTEEPGKLYAVREASPLILGVGIDGNYFASDVTALVNHTRNVIYLEDGEFAELAADSVTVFDCLGKTVEKRISRILWDVQAAEKGGYAHLCLRRLWSSRARSGRRLRRGSRRRNRFDELRLSAEELRVFADRHNGLRSAYYAGCAGNTPWSGYAGSRGGGARQRASLQRPLIDGSTLVIVISRPGKRRIRSPR